MNDDELLEAIMKKSRQIKTLQRLKDFLIEEAYSRGVPKKDIHNATSVNEARLRQKLKIKELDRQRDDKKES